MASKTPFFILALLVLLIIAFVATLIMSTPNNLGGSTPRDIHLIAPNTLGYSGVGPTTVSLNWTQSTDASFFEYDLQRYSTILNGWETVANLPFKTNTTFFSARPSAGVNEFWQVVYRDTTGFTYSNTLDITHPQPASLSSSQLSPTSVLLRWNNGAKYGGLLYFSSYQLMESVDDGRYFSQSTYQSPAVLSLTMNGLSPSTRYSFYLNTTDQCIGAGCPTNPYSSSSSNIVTVNTPGMLVASASTVTSSVDVGQPATFYCSAGGGIFPFTYSWNFGDGTLGVGPDSSHTYASTGTMKAICVVMDSLGTTAAATPITIPVYLDPSVALFKVSDTKLVLGHAVTFSVATIGGNGTLAYSYSNLPDGCSSNNSSSLSCVPRTIGNFAVTVRVTDRGGETATATLVLSIDSPRIFGLPQNLGIEIIIGSIAGVCTLAISIIAARRRKISLESVRKKDT